jgi:hypothetical protein
MALRDWAWVDAMPTSEPEYLSVLFAKGCRPTAYAANAVCESKNIGSKVGISHSSLTRCATSPAVQGGEG